MTTYFTRLPSPVGPLRLVKSAAGLHRLDFEDRTEPNDLAWREDKAAFSAEARQLEEYCAGDRDHFDLELAPQGTPFQLRVWRALRDIPFGRTASYVAIARAVGSPSASRAVGGANHRNPIAIVIPCHRVIGASGSLTGYGGGLDRKRWLLAHEARYLRRYTEMIGTPSCVST